MANILIVDDDQITLTMLKVILAHEGYQVSVAADGFQGLKIAKSQRPDLILLDLMLPGIDGFEICTRLRQDPATAHVPVLIISAKSQETDRQVGAKVGANGYLAKPFQPTELLAQVRLFLEPSSTAVRAIAPLQLTGAAIALVSARESDAVSSVVVNTALALADGDATVTLVDLRPFSVEYGMKLGCMPRAEPFNLKHEPATLSREVLQTRPGGLRLLDNLEGSGDVGQIMQEDVAVILDELLPESGYLVLSLSLYPIELLRDVATRSSLIALVTPIDPTGLASARSTLGLIERVGVTNTRVGLVLIGDASTPTPELGRDVLATLSPSATSTDPSFATLAARLRERGERSAA